MHDDGLTPVKGQSFTTCWRRSRRGSTAWALFGSRAMGRASPQSDVDLVIYGADDPRLVDQLFTLFDESLLPMTVDVVDYDRTTIRRSRSTSTRSFGSCSIAAI